jgi:hypothetical protein
MVQVHSYSLKLIFLFFKQHTQVSHGRKLNQSAETSHCQASSLYWRENFLFFNGEKKKFFEKKENI